MPRSGERWVSYEVKPTGYKVMVMNGRQLLHEYEAGNNPLDSSPEASVSAGSGLSQTTLREYARQTASELAEEWDASLID